MDLFLAAFSLSHSLSLSLFYFFFVLLRKFYIFSVGIAGQGGREVGLEYIYIWQLAALSGLRYHGQSEREVGVAGQKTCDWC